MPATLSNPTAGIDKLLDQMDGELFVRLMKRAQKMALIEWRDKRTFPGLMDRFTKEGAQARQFHARLKSTNARKHGLPDYWQTGRLRTALLARQPKSENRGSGRGNFEAVTKLKYGGLSLNALSNKFGVTSETRTPIVISSTIAGYEQGRKGKHGTRITVTVKSYVQKRKSFNHQVVRCGVSYSAEFAEISEDVPFIKSRVEFHFRQIIAGLRLRGGLIVSDYHPEFDAFAA